MDNLREELEKIVWKAHPFTHYQGDREWATQDISEKEAVDQILELFEKNIEEVIGDDEYSAQINGEKAQDEYDDRRNQLRKELRAKVRELIKK